MGFHYGSCSNKYSEMDCSGDVLDGTHARCFPPPNTRE